MLQNLVANILNKVLGEYVADLSTKNLEVDVWKGIRSRPSFIVV